MKTRTRLIIGFSVILALLWSIGFYAWDLFGNLDRQFNTVEEDIIPDTVAMTEVETISSEIYRQVSEYVSHNTEEAKSTARLKLSRLEEIGLEYLPISALTGNLEHGKDCILAGKIYDFYFSASWLIDLKERGANYDKLLARDRSMNLPILLAMQERASEVKAASIEELTMAKTSFDEAYINGLHSIYLSAAIITLLAITAAIFTTRSIVRPLYALHKGTEMIAKGNLNYKVGTEAKDEIGELSRAFDKMTLSLSTSMTSIDNLNQEITERKRAEGALRESEQKFRNLFEHAKDVVILADAQTGTIVDVNPAGCSLLGLPKDKILGIHQSALHPPEMAVKYKRIFREHVENRITLTDDVIIQRSDGSQVSVDVSASVIKLTDKQIIQGVFRDITERKLAEEKLRESQKFAFSLLENAPHATVVINPDTSIRYVNPAWEKLNGWTSSEIIGTKAPYPWWPDEDKETFFNGFMEALKQDSGQGEIISQKKNGELYWINMNWASVTDNEELQYLLINSVDITERKQAEEKQQAIISTAIDGFWICHLDGTFLEVNDSYCRMTGYTREELLKMSIQDIEAIEHPEQTAQRLKKIVEHGSDRFETQHKRKDGKIIDIEICVNYLNIGKGQMFVFVRDITERKLIEDALRESEEKFSAAFRSSPDMMAIVNLQDGKYVEVNESFINFSGYSRQELIGHTNQEFSMWINREEKQKMDQLLDETGQMRHEEFLFRTKSGEIRTWLCSADIINIGGAPCMLAVATDITERKKVQEALHESEERFSKAFHASPGSMSISRLKDGIFIEVNESFLKDKGYNREEVIGHSSAELGIWKDENHRNKVLQVLQEQGKVRNELTQFCTKTGELRTGYLSAEFITLGNEPCMIIQTTDITQLKQAEEQLRLLSSVTQQVSDSTIVIDTNFKITYMNQAAQDLFGYTLEEARGNMLGLFDARLMTRKERENINRTITSGKVLNSVSTKRCKDGSTITCSGSLSPLFDEKGEICSYIDVQRDISKQKEVEAKLQVHKQLIERILATMPEGVLVIGDNDRIILANVAFHKIFHRNTKVTENKLLSEIIPKKQLSDLYDKVKQEQEEHNTLEFRHKVKNIEKIILCNIIRMEGERTLLTFTDISREREEEEKLYLTDRLASIGEMAAGLAHELNNPLTGVLALSQLLIDSDISDEYKEDLQCVFSEAQRAASIVKNVLLFARNNNYENGQASVNEVIQNVLRLREYEQKVFNIKVVTDFQENLPFIPIDKFQLQQVFLNIVLNAEAAIRDTKRAGTLTVTTERTNNHVNILFNDNGCGIKKHILPRIYDPFFTTKDIGKGTGLGLSICYGIVVKNGGKLSVKSRVNEGTTFTVRMPIIA